MPDLPDGYSIELRQDGESVVIPPREIISLDGTREPSAMSDLQVEIPESGGAEDWALADLYLWYTEDGVSELIFRGELTSPNSDIGGNTTTLDGPDVIKKLDRGGAREVYQSIQAWKAIDDYATTHLDAWDITVYEPQPDTIDEGLVVQNASTTSEFENLTSPAADDPITAQNDEVPVLQTAFAREGLDRDRDTDPSFVTDDDEASDGSAIGVGSSSAAAEWDFPNREHTIPASAVGVYIRSRGSDNLQESEIVLAVAGTEYVLDYFSGGESFLRSWRDYASSPFNGDGYTGGDIAPSDSATLIVRGTGTNGGTIWQDVVALVDTRFAPAASDCDDQVHEPQGYLDDPPLYNAFTFAFDEYSQSFNVDAADLTTTQRDTSEDQALQVSNEGGTEWYPQDGTEQNTETISVDFGEAGAYGTTIQGRVTLGGWSPNGAQNATPRYGYDYQAVDSWELAIDTNTLAVLDDYEVVGSHLENFQDLHREAGQVFVPQYEDGKLPLESFVPGQLTRQTDWTRTGGDRDRDLFDYANVLTVFGAEDGSGGRLTATAESQTEIDKRGRIPAPPLWKPEIENSDQLSNIARTRLAEHIAEDELSGSLEVAPTNIAPGYAYEVPAFDGQETVLRQVNYGLDGTTLKFREPADLAADIVDVRVDLRQTKRTI